MRRAMAGESGGQRAGWILTGSIGPEVLSERKSLSEKHGAGTMSAPTVLEPWSENTAWSGI